MKLTQEQISRLEEKLGKQWTLSPLLFGDNYDLHDFDGEAYIFFIDNVESHGGLIEGLDSLSPFADDALAVAKRMTQGDFDEFKKYLRLKPRWKGSLVLKRTEIGEMPGKYIPLILPQLFLEADCSLIKDYGISLGTYLIKTIRAQEGVTIQ